MPTGRAALGLAAASNGKLYAIGGFNEGNGTVTSLGTVEEYDPATNTWATKAPMPSARLGLAVATASNGKVYAVGGFANGDGSPPYIVQEYDPSANAWNTKASLPTPRYYLGLAPAPNGKLYAIGGIDYRAGANSTASEEYDPSTNTWTSRSPMPTARAALAMATAPNGRLYAIGGYDNKPYPSNYTTLVEELDPATIVNPPPVASADLAISQTDSPDPVAVGGVLTYTIVARNNGPQSATGVTLTDSLPAGVNFVSASTSQGSCSGTATLTCALGSLANGASATVSIGVRATAAGGVANTARITGNEADPASANNAETEGTTVLTTADLSRLTVAVEGQGRVTSNPAGIDCHPNSCVANYGPGASVSLTAAAANGWRFDHWERACQGQTSTCNLTLGSDLLVKAVGLKC